MKKLLISIILFFLLFLICLFEYKLLKEYSNNNNSEEVKTINPGNSIKQLNDYVKIKVNTKEIPSDFKDYINSYIIDEIVEIKVSDDIKQKINVEITKMDSKLKEFINNYKEKDKIKNKVDVIRDINSTIKENTLDINIDMNISTPYTDPIYLDYKTSIDIQKNKVINEENKIMLSQEQIAKFTDYLFINMKKYFNNNYLIFNNKKINLTEYINNKDILINNLMVNIDDLNYYIDNNIICTQYTDLDILNYMKVSIFKKNFSVTKINIYKFE